MESLKNQIFSTPLLRVLDFLLHQKGEVSDPEMAEKISGVKRASVHQALTRLTQLGIIERTHQGRRCYNIVRSSHAWVTPFKVASNLLEVAPLVELLKPISTKVVLFGSRADGTNDMKSDFDLFVVTREGEEVSKRIDEFDTEDLVQLIIKTEGEMLDLEESEPTFAKELRKGIVLWEV